mgnify:CR=1 FL=1
MKVPGSRGITMKTPIVATSTSDPLNPTNRTGAVKWRPDRIRATEMACVTAPAGGALDRNSHDVSRTAQAAMNTSKPEERHIPPAPAHGHALLLAYQPTDGHDRSARA